MTDSVTSLRAATPKAATAKSPGVVLGVALLLVACGGDTPPDVSSQPPLTPLPGPLAVAPAAPVAPVAAPGPVTGLTPLPSADQVVASVSSGRVDPFAPLQTTRAQVGARPALALPQGLVFNGVIRSGGTPEALVQFSGESGTLRVGQKGGRTTTLLPDGWSVASIDVQKGRLTLRHGGQLVTAPL